jgi:D-alanyl-D-alanine carboxypeptidase
MMTAAVALNHLSLDHQVKVTDAETHLDSSATMMGLSPGEVLTVRELLYGIFLLSANDAAEALAGATGSRDAFLAEMNRTAAAWGLDGAHFSNPTGLDDPGLHASARDLAVIAGHLMQDHPEVVPIAATKQTTLPGGPLHKQYDMVTVNGLVLHDYPGADGLKTGLTDNAGYCIAASAMRGGRHLLVVVLNSETDLQDARQILDYGFSTAPIPT